MNVDIKETLRRANFCLANKIPVYVDTKDVTGTFIPLHLIKRFNDKKEPIYEMCMADAKAQHSSITLGVEDVDWPTSGGGFICSG